MSAKVLHTPTSLERQACLAFMSFFFSSLMFNLKQLFVVVNMLTDKEEKTHKKQSNFMLRLIGKFGSVLQDYNQAF